MNIKEISRFVFYMLSAIFICGTPFADAEEFKWEQVPLLNQAQKNAGLPGGEGMQYVYSIVYAPSNPNIVYFSTDISRIWKSVDSGKTWKPCNNGFLSNGARSLAVDPDNPDFVLAAGFLGGTEAACAPYPNKLMGIWKTTDGGNSWALKRKTEFYSQESKGDLLAFIKANSKKMIFCGSYSEGLLVSSDDGETWRKAGFDGHRIIDMKPCFYTNAGLLYVATDKGLFSYFSNGSTQKIGTGLPIPPKSIALSVKQPAIVYASAGKNGVYKSVNYGRNFVVSNNNLSLWGNDYTDIAASPAKQGFLYTKRALTGGSPSYTHDAAVSWNNPTDINLGNLLESSGFYFSAPFAPHPSESLVALTASNGRARIMRTTDGGKTWGYSGSGFTGGLAEKIIFTEGGKRLSCLTDHGLWLTDENGLTTSLPTGTMFGLRSSSNAAVKGNLIVASMGSWSNKGIIVSRDSGQNWEQFENVNGVFKFIKIFDNNSIIAGSYRSSDCGKTWSMMPYNVVAGFQNKIYGIKIETDNTTSVMVSSDYGKSWSEASPKYPYRSVNGMAVTADSIYIASSFGVWVYKGSKWELRNFNNGLDLDNFGACYISSIAVDNNRKIYVGRQAPGYGMANGIFRSLDDSGLIWENISGNLHEINVFSININQFDNSIYIGTGHGTWRLSQPII